AEGPRTDDAMYEEQAYMASTLPARKEPAPAPATDGDFTPNILEAAGVTKVFGGLVAVENVSFNIPRRSIVSIIGPNGAGKTTYFNMLTGLYKPSSGGIWFDGQNITGMRPDRIVKAGMAR